MFPSMVSLVKNLDLRQDDFRRLSVPLAAKLVLIMLNEFRCFIKGIVILL